MDNLISRIIATSQGGLGSSSSFIVMQIPGFWGGWGPQSPSPAEASLQPFLRPPPTSAALARWLLPCLPTHLRLFTLCLAVWCFLPLITSAGFSAAAYPGTCLLVSSSIFLPGGHPGKHCVTFPPPPGRARFLWHWARFPFFVNSWGPSLGLSACGCPASHHSLCGTPAMKIAKLVQISRWILCCLVDIYLSTYIYIDTHLYTSCGEIHWVYGRYIELLHGASFFFRNEATSP